jgi:hypothetical protein
MLPGTDARMLPAEAGVLSPEEMPYAGLPTTAVSNAL